MPVIHASYPCQLSMPVIHDWNLIIHASHQCQSWPPPHTKLYQQNQTKLYQQNQTKPYQAKPYQTILLIHTKKYHVSSLYLQLSITAISILNATLLSCHFRKIATASHFWLVYLLSLIFDFLSSIRIPGFWNCFMSFSVIFASFSSLFCLN